MSHSRFFDLSNTSVCPKLAFRQARISHVIPLFIVLSNGTTLTKRPTPDLPRNCRLAISILGTNYPQACMNSAPLYVVPSRAGSEAAGEVPASLDAAYAQSHRLNVLLKKYIRQCRTEFDTCLSAGLSFWCSWVPSRSYQLGCFDGSWPSLKS